MKRKRMGGVLFVALALATGVALSIKPWQIYGEQRKLADGKAAEMVAAEAGRTKLMEQKARLESATGREEMARKQGYLKPGEQPLELN